MSDVGTNALRLGSEPAAPVGEPTSQNFGVRQHLGLSKRELLAAMAMQGILSAPQAPNGGLTTEQMAAAAVECADALLQELAK